MILVYIVYNFKDLFIFRRVLVIRNLFHENMIFIIYKIE